MSTAATRYASGTPQCPRQGKCSCRAPQIIDFKLRWRRISTRQLTEALPKARQGLVFLRSTPTSTQRTRPVQCHPAATHHANGAKYCPRQGKARQVLMLLPAAHQLQATLASNLYTPADRSTAQDKASACAAPCITPTSTQRTRPVQCHPAATHHASGAKYCPRQGKCSCCSPQHTNVQATLASNL